MTILAETAGWNSTITNVLLVVHVAVCLLLCLVVLMQRPKQEGLGAAFGGGMTDQAFGARTTDVLQKGTVYLASLLFIVTLILSILVGTKSRNASISDELESSGVSAVEDNAATAAAAAAAATESTEESIDLSSELEKVTGEGEENAGETAEEEVPTPAPTPETTILETAEPADPPTPETSTPEQ